MKITERLKVEHGVFLRQLRHLERLLADGATPDAVRACIETIALADEFHSLIEDRLLYPALAEALGRDVPALQEIDRDHRRIRELLATIRGGDTAEDTVRSLIETLVRHMEREIHAIFPLAEEVLTEARLESMCRWDAEHVFDSVGQAEAWIDEMAAGQRAPAE